MDRPPESELEREWGVVFGKYLPEPEGVRTLISAMCAKPVRTSRLDDARPVPQAQYVSYVHFAAADGSLCHLRLLLEHGADVNLRGPVRAESVPPRTKALHRRDGLR